MDLLGLFWSILKVNCLSTSGSTSIGLLHNETVGKFITERQFTEAVALANMLPGSKAIQLAVYVGYSHGGVLGALTALTASILPAAFLIFAVIYLLKLLGKDKWMDDFFKGIEPAIIALTVLIAFDMTLRINSDYGKAWFIGVSAIIALYFNAPAPLVLFLAGVVGVLILK